MTSFLQFLEVSLVCYCAFHKDRSNKPFLPHCTPYGAFCRYGNVSTILCGFSGVQNLAKVSVWWKVIILSTRSATIYAILHSADIPVFIVATFYFSYYSFHTGGCFKLLSVFFFRISCAKAYSHSHNLCALSYVRVLLCEKCWEMRLVTTA